MEALKELRRFMGRANKFSPNLTECSQPPCELLSPRKAWVWGPAQEEAFRKAKEELTKPTVLALCNPNAKANICADASGCLTAVSRGRGLDTNCVCLQVHVWVWDGATLQIKKEAFVLVWACEEKFAYNEARIDQNGSQTIGTPPGDYSTKTAYHQECWGSDYASQDSTILLLMERNETVS